MLSGCDRDRDRGRAGRERAQEPGQRQVQLALWSEPEPARRQAQLALWPEPARRRAASMSE